MTQVMATTSAAAAESRECRKDHDAMTSHVTRA
jgi:hypothetical protein